MPGITILGKGIQKNKSPCFLGITVLGKWTHRIKTLLDWSVFGGQNKCGTNSEILFMLSQLFCFVFGFFPEILIHHRYITSDQLMR